MTEIYKYLHEIFTLITNGVFSLIKTIFNFRKYELSEYANPFQMQIHSISAVEEHAKQYQSLPFGSLLQEAARLIWRIFQVKFLCHTDIILSIVLLFLSPFTIDKFYLESFGRSKEFSLWLLGFVWLNILVLMKFQFVSQLSNLKYNLLIY